MKNHSKIKIFCFVIIAILVLIPLIYSHFAIAKDFKMLKEGVLATVISAEDFIATKNDKTKTPISTQEKEELKKIIEVLKQTPDAISYANQLGRLDLVSISIAMFSVVLGVGAVFGFLHIKEGSRLVAKEATEHWLEDGKGKKILEKRVMDWFESGKGKEFLNNKLRKWLENRGENGLTPVEEAAQSILQFEKENEKIREEEEKERLKSWLKSRGDNGLTPVEEAVKSILQSEKDNERAQEGKK